MLKIINAPENKDWVLEGIRNQLIRNSGPDSISNEIRLAQVQKLLDENLQHVFRRIDGANSPVSNQIPNQRESHTGYLRLLRWSAAVAAAIALFAGIFHWADIHTLPTEKNHLAQNTLDFKPGKNAAILTVDGGKEIYLDSHTTGSVARQGNSSVTTTNGQVQYSRGLPVSQTIYNTLRTSNGNQFSLVLPDGSRVWLNAASSIRYPVAFNGSSREVEVTGELYFEVKHNTKQPFIVHANGHKIEDIGTSFNVHAYSGERSFSTTLLEGAVKIGDIVLKPGTQALIRDGKLTVQTADTTQVIAWKNGLFAFHQTPVKEVMRQIARWYDVEVIYEDVSPTMRFGGKISRNANASVVLTILKKSGLTFKVEGRKIIVTGDNQPE